MSKKEASNSRAVVIGTLFLHSKPFSVLFDSGATHFFISTRDALLLSLEDNKEEVAYRIGLPNRHVLKCSTLYKDVPILIGEHRFPGDLIQFDLSEFDVILGMNWLTSHGEHIDCKALKVILKDSKGRKVYFCGERTKKENRIISTMKAGRMLRKGCVGYWCYALEVKEEEVRVEDIPVVCEFPNVFPEELPGLPPEREINFEIKLMPGDNPFIKLPIEWPQRSLKN